MSASMPAPREPEDTEPAGDAGPLDIPRPPAKPRAPRARPAPAGKSGAPRAPRKTPPRSKPAPVKSGAEPAIPPKPPLPAQVVEADGETILVPPMPPLPAGDTADEAPAADDVEAAADAPSSEDEVIVEDTLAIDAAPVAEVAPVIEESPVVADAPDPAVVEDDASAAEALAVALGDEVHAGVDMVVPALELRGVTKLFGASRAVDGIDLTVPAGTFYGLVGPNGAGKTTTLSMIAGLLTPDRGTVSVNGIDAASDPLGAKRAMGVLPDRLRTFDRLTGRQLLYYYGTLRGLSPTVVESRTIDLARAFDLTDALGRLVSDYSAGMTKKVMLAGAMIHSPRLLVLDEPFEAVDPVSSAVILDILAAYVSHGGTVVLSSHGMDLVERVCSRVAVMVAGQVLAEGTVDEVRGELTLEQRFIELAGGLGDVEGLEWLHTFSD